MSSIIILILVVAALASLYVFRKTAAVTALTTKVAELGQNNQFVAAMAHIGWGFSLTSLFAASNVYIGAAALTVAAGVKEFYFDRLHEKTPPQTFMDDATDFATYLVGIGANLLAVHFGL